MREWWESYRERLDEAADNMPLPFLILMSIGSMSIIFYLLGIIRLV